ERPVVRSATACHPHWEVLTGLDLQHRLADFRQQGAHTGWLINTLAVSVVLTLITFCMAPIRLTYLSRNRRGSIWRAISRLPKLSDSPCRPLSSVDRPCCACSGPLVAQGGHLRRCS